MLAAQRLGLSILELEEAPFYWRDRALIAISAENWAEHRQHELARLKSLEKKGHR